MDENNNGLRISVDNGEAITVDKSFNGFDIFAIDGSDLDRYRHWQKGFLGLFVKVNEAEQVVIRNWINPKVEKVKVLDSGLHILWPPVIREYIFAPKPEAPVKIDYLPTNAEDEKKNFTFKAKYKPKKNEKLDSSVVVDDDGELKIYVTIDYVVDVTLVDPAVYIRNKSPLANLKSEIVGLIEGYTTNNYASYLIDHKNEINLDKIDPKGILKKFEIQNGLRVESLTFKRVDLPKAIMDVMEETAKKDFEIKKAHKEAEVKRVTAKGEADAMEIKAVGEGKSMEIKAQSEAKAITYKGKAEIQLKIDKLNYIMASLLKNDPSIGVENATKIAMKYMITTDNPNARIWVDLNDGNTIDPRNISDKMLWEIYEKLMGLDNNKIDESKEDGKIGGKLR